MSNYSLLTKAVIFFAAFSGLIVLKKFRNTAVEYFIYFLFFILFSELVASYPRYFKFFEKTYLIEETFFEKNYWWYTLSWSLGSALFFSFYFQKIINTKLYKFILRLSRNLFFVSSVVYIALNFEEFKSSIIYFIYIFGILLIFISIILYFFELLKTDKILFFYKSIHFYIGSILLIWFLSTTPLIFYDIYTISADWNFILLKWKIRLLANIFMYLGFAIVLFLCRPKPYDYLN